MIRIGVVGFGYWGPNLVRNFAEAKGARVVRVCDARAERLAIAAKRYPGIEVGQDPMELIHASDVDAVVIATPVSSHFPLALEALRSGKHVLVEKPLASTSEQALRLIDEAERRKLTLLVDHTFVYTGAVRQIRERVDSGSLGDIYYYDSVRVNLGLFQHDMNVLWDLAVHDLSIMDYVLRSRPCAVSATGISHIPGEPENVAYLTLFFETPLIAHVHVNWLAPVKVRRTLIGGASKMIVYDDLEPSEKVKIYDKGITVTNRPEDVYAMLISYRTGDMHAPQLQTVEALETEANHFLGCIEGREVPISGGEAGLQVVSLLEAASSSLKQRGRPVEIKPVMVMA